MAALAGVDVEVLPGTLNGPVDPAAVEARLRDDRNHEFKAILVVQVDTVTTVINDIEAIRGAIDAAEHPALFMVDCIASLACVPFEMDAWGVDVTVSATQKGLMVPPGLGFVWANAKAWVAYETADLKRGYFDWGPRADKDAPHYYRYAGTPPVQHIFGLREALDMLAEEGLENTWHRHDVLAQSVHAAVGAKWPVLERSRPCGPGRPDAGNFPRRVRGPSVPYRPHGPPQSADVVGHSRHHRGRTEGARSDNRRLWGRGSGRGRGQGTQSLRV